MTSTSDSEAPSYCTEHCPFEISAFTSSQLAEVQDTCTPFPHSIYFSKAQNSCGQHGSPAALQPWWNRKQAWKNTSSNPHWARAPSHCTPGYFQSSHLLGIDFLSHTDLNCFALLSSSITLSVNSASNISSDCICSVPVYWHRQLQKSTPWLPSLCNTLGFTGHQIAKMKKLKPR